jgi:hypothetical protein
MPRRMACVSVIENQTSTRFSHDTERGVKCTWIRGVRGQPVTDQDSLVGGLV